MEISFDNKEKENKKDLNLQKKIQRLRSKNPTWELAWRVLIACAIIDLSLWGYFHFVKGMGFWEGLASISKSNKKEEEKTQKIVKIYEYQTRQVQPQQMIAENEIKFRKDIENNENIKPKYIVKNDAIYSWTDENGRRGFSNIGFPKDKKYTDPKIEF